MSAYSFFNAGAFGRMWMTLDAENGLWPLASRYFGREWVQTMYE